MSARLSPAASLLRNSKLFALPPAISLPVAPPSSSEISHSETATTPFPRFAAIETTETSRKLGDWGFKRPLPEKSLRTTNSPVVRLVKGIDTAEHVADFESAADHVLTLRKFSELDQPLMLAGTDTFQRGGYARRLNEGVFRPGSDNTTNLSSTAPHYAGHAGLYGEASSARLQAQLPTRLRQKEGEIKPAPVLARKTDPTKLKRWRYNGPSLTSISGEEFNQYLKGLGEKERALLHDRIREVIVKNKESSARAGDTAVVQEKFTKEDVTEQELQEYIRYLRSAPSTFGPLIAQVLDLPSVQPPARHKDNTSWWDYGTSTLASARWEAEGTPTTHPSAGLSYATGTHAVNHPRFGPQAVNNPVVARAVKKVSRSNDSQGTQYGVAGFIMSSSSNVRTLGPKAFEKSDGGQKTVVAPKVASISTDGTLNMLVNEQQQFDILNDKAVTGTEMQEAKTAAEISAEEQGERGVRPAPQFSDTSIVKRLPLRARPQRDNAQEIDLDAVLGRKR